MPLADTIDDQHLDECSHDLLSSRFPWVTSVGGTSLLLSSSDAILSETHGAVAGVASVTSPRCPPIRKASSRVQQQFNNQRGTPDVSVDEDNTTGPAIYRQGQWQLAGGNSGMPIWAGLQAIANQMAGHPLGFINPGLYKLATSANYQQDFHDITQGDNTNAQAGVKGYSAAAGWDPVTGLGTPNAENLIPDLIAP